MMILDDYEALKAVKQIGWALRFVRNQTYEICLAAVKQNEHALQHVKALEIFKRIANELDIDIEI